MAFVAVFLEAACGSSAPLLGAQIDLLPALMVYTALTNGIVTIVLLAVCGGLWFDSLSLNPLGASVLPLLVIGVAIYRSRELLMREHAFAQVVLGVSAGGVSTAGDALHFAQHRRRAAAGLDFALAMAGHGRRRGGVVTPLCFTLFDRLHHAFDYPPAAANELPARPGNQTGAHVICLYLT